MFLSISPSVFRVRQSISISPSLSWAIDLSFSSRRRSISVSPSLSWAIDLSFFSHGRSISLSPSLSWVISLSQGLSMCRRMAARSGSDHRQRPPPLTFPPSFPHSTPFPYWISQNEIIKANAVSGIAVNDECKLKFLELKAKRTHQFIIYKIDEKLKQVIVEKIGEPTMGYEDFTASLPENECRYAIYDFDFVAAENCQKSKIFFIACEGDGFASSIDQALEFCFEECADVVDYL